MADKIVSEVILSADASQLTSTFDELVNAITKTKEELREYKNDKEKSAELTKQLADQEMKLAQVIAKNNNVIDSSNVSYKQLDDILKDLRKTYKTTSDEIGRSDLAPAIKSINNELKGMDASLGDYKRNVGNYENAITSAADNMSRSFVSLAKTLPSLADGPEQFFMQLAQQLPNIIRAYKNLKEARDASAAGASQDATAHRAEAGEAAESTQAHQAETTAVIQSAGSHLAEAEALRDSAKAELEAAKANREAFKAKRDNLIIEQESINNTLLELTNKGRLMQTDAEYAGRLREINQLKAQSSQLSLDLAMAENELTAAEIGVTNAETKLAAAEKVVEEQRKMQTAGGALKGLIKTLISWQTLILAIIMVLAIFGKDILNWAKNLNIFNSEARKAARFQKEWNKEMREGHQNAAQQIVDLQIYSKWAQMTTKTDKERTLAAKEVLKTLGSAVTQTNIAKVKNGEYQSSIDNVTKALVRQAQAQAMTNKITEKYKDVIEAQDKLTQAKNGKLDFWGTVSRVFNPMPMGSIPSSDQTQSEMDNAMQGSIDRAQKKLDKVKEDFDKWLEKFLEDFNPSDLLFNGGKGPDGDNWFSKWELYIKEYEATLIKFQGIYEELDYASIWKFSAEGLKYYTKMYDEYIEHYSADEKQFREAQVNKQKYLAEFQEYHTKLQTQYMDSLKTEYQVDMDRLQEWYDVQKEIYKNAGEDTTALEAEYAKRKQDILDKYIDKYRNAEMERMAIDHSINNDLIAYNKAMMDLDLKNLDDNMEKEIKEYQRKGIETTNLEEHYAIERMKIISRYAKEETDAIIANIQKQEQALLRRNEQMLQYNNMGGSRYNTELAYARMGGTTITGHQQRQNEINAKTNEFNIWQDSAQQQIQAMQDVLASGKLIGDERLEMETALADAERELALGTAEYRMELNEMVLEDASATTEDYMGYASTTFQALGNIFNNVYSAIESNIEAEKKAGKISEEEAEKRLEEYKGIQAAAAMMSTLASAVDAYRSIVGVPYVGIYLAPIAAAAALAAGIANVKQIMATSKNNISATNSYANAAPSLSEYTPQYVVNATGKDDTDYLANAVSERPVKTYVVSSDVTAAQEIANKTDSEATW